jgi:hypothetical protein
LWFHGSLPSNALPQRSACAPDGASWGDAPFLRSLGRTRRSQANHGEYFDLGLRGALRCGSQRLPLIVRSLPRIAALGSAGYHALRPSSRAGRTGFRGSLPYRSGLRSDWIQFCATANGRRLLEQLAYGAAAFSDVVTVVSDLHRTCETFPSDQRPASAAWLQLNLGLVFPSLGDRRDRDARADAVGSAARHQARR